MTETIGFRCDDCQHGFVAERLTPTEADNRRRQHKQVGQIQCPKCGSIKIRAVSV